MVGEICERTPGMAAPTAPSAPSAPRAATAGANGFPSVAHRSKSRFSFARRTVRDSPQPES